MKNCLIVDNDPAARHALRAFFDKIPNVHIQECATALDTLSILHSNKMDMMFLDTDLPDMNGMDLLRSLATKPPVVIVSTDSSFAIEAFDLDVVDYILKPVSFVRLLRAYNRVLGMQQADTNRAETAPAIEKEEFIYLHSGKKNMKFDFSDVLYIKAYSNYSKVHRTNDRVDLVNENLSNLIQKLPPSHFLRVHKSYIISLSKLEATANAEVTINDEPIPIGISYKRSYKNYLEQRSY